MSDTLQTTAGLLDIEPPLLPVDSGFSSTLIGLTLIILLIIVATFSVRTYTSYRSRARRRLHRLQQSVQYKLNKKENNDIDAVDVRETAYQLARLLSAGVGINGVTGSTVLPIELMHHHERWQRFTRELSAARFARNDSQSSILNDLFKESLFWLKNWP